MPLGRRCRRRSDAADDAAAVDVQSTCSKTEVALAAPAAADDWRPATGQATSTFDRRRAYATPADSAPSAAAAVVDDVDVEDAAVWTDRLRLTGSRPCHG